MDFSDKTGRPASVLLIGDNGSGKSTLVDALEFGLQGRIARAGSLDSSIVPSALSFFDPSGASITLNLRPEGEVRRTIEFSEDGKFNYDRSPHPRFSLSPLVLRRSDILHFWGTPDEKKQVLFFGYFQPTAEHDIDGTFPTHLRETEEQLFELKRKRRDVWQKLALHIGPAAIDGLNAGLDLDKWITQHVYKGVPSDVRKELKRNGKPILISNHDHKLTLELRQLSQLIMEKDSVIKSIRKTHKGERLHQATQKGLEQVSAFATDAFAKLSTAGTFVKQIEIRVGTLTAVSLSIEVRLRNGTSTTPQKIFSEANLDLLALLIYVAIAEQSASQGQAKVLVLDDVFQSIDETTRLCTIEYILEKLNGWQLLLTVHDRLWGEHVRSVFRRMGVPLLDREIRRWTFEGGPEIYDAQRVPISGLQTALERGEVYQICAEAGLLLEKLCNRLSYTIPISIIRKKDDKYTLGDLWPGILKALQKTTTSQQAGEVDKWMHLRNISGAHYNEWAATLSRDAANAFGVGVIALFERFYCIKCESWVDVVKLGSSKTLGWRCRCGATQVAPA